MSRGISNCTAPAELLVAFAIHCRARAMCIAAGSAFDAPCEAMRGTRCLAYSCKENSPCAPVASHPLERWLSSACRPHSHTSGSPIPCSAYSARYRAHGIRSVFARDTGAVAFPGRVTPSRSCAYSRASQAIVTTILHNQHHDRHAHTHDTHRDTQAGRRILYSLTHILFLPPAHAL